MSEPWFDALRRTAEAQRHSSADVHGVSVRPSQLLALLEIAAAAKDFIGTTTVFRQQKVSRDAFTRLAVAVYWPDDPRAANSQASAAL